MEKNIDTIQTLGEELSPLHHGISTLNIDFRHPVTNQFLPSELSDRDFLREAGDLRDKTWDEELLQEWESTENGGLAWTGRVDLRNEDSQDDVNVS